MPRREGIREGQDGANNEFLQDRDLLSVQTFTIPTAEAVSSKGGKLFRVSVKDTSKVQACESVELGGQHGKPFYKMSVV